jgi:spermidine synthase
MKYIEVPCTEENNFKIAVKGLVFKEVSKYQEIAIYDTESFGRCLFLDGVIQCSESDHAIYDKAILRKLKTEDNKILILGGGDGYTAETALKMNPHLKITVVEIDDVVINACKTYLSQTVFDDARVKLIMDDAYNFLNKAETEMYDGIICDLTELPVGYDDGKFSEFFSVTFLSSEKLLGDRAWISVFAGNQSDLLHDMLNRTFKNTETSNVFVPSFGELSHFLYGDKQ